MTPCGQAGTPSAVSGRLNAPCPVARPEPDATRTFRAGDIEVDNHVPHDDTGIGERSSRRHVPPPDEGDHGGGEYQLMQERQSGGYPMSSLTLTPLADERIQRKEARQ